MIAVGQAHSRYEQFVAERDPALSRAEEAAKVTIPSVFVETGHSRSTDLQTPYQGLGARAVNTLASKVMLALFPPNTSFFRISFDALTKAQFSEEDLTEIEAQLGTLEQVIVGELEKTRLRPLMYTAIRHMLVAGNGVLRLDKDGKLKFFPLRQYVVQRDPEGTVTLLCIKEEVTPDVLSDEVRAKTLQPQDDNPESTLKSNTIDVYTVMEREGNRYKVRQEINGIVVPKSEGSYPIDSPPYIVLRWTNISGEDYGRGMVDEYFGDFAALDDLSRNLLDCAANMSHLLWILNPNSYLTERKFSEAKSGDVLKGNREDISAVNADKGPDLQFVLQRVTALETHIKEAFLMNSSIQRHAERVTAEEVRFMATELENALGGVYSLLSYELQMPLLRRFIKVLERKQLLPAMPDDVDISITTGIEALGRGQEVQKLLQFVQSAQNAFGPEVTAQHLNVDVGLSALATGLGLTNNGLIKDPEQLQAEQQQAAQQQAAQSVAPKVAEAALNQNQEQ